MIGTALFALHDTKNGGARRVHPENATVLNSKGYGIFHTVNEFTGARRTVNTTAIRHWFVDIDGNDKEAQVQRLRDLPVLPTLVVESKAGFHAYWRAQDGTLENWKRIVRWGLVPALGADPRATDPLRLLRAPGYQHLKDPESPYLVGVVWDVPSVSYTERQMMAAFPSQKPEREERTPGQATTFWGKVGELDGRTALLKLSGHDLVNGEVFELVQMSNGNCNIHVERKDTGCFIDRDGKFGNVTDGVSIGAWCKWYGHSWADIAKGLKEVFPELEDKCES